MHPFGDNGQQSGVPAFLAKLWRLVEDTETNNLIAWSSVSMQNGEFSCCLI
jgi:heat shock transcription factor 1